MEEIHKLRAQISHIVQANFQDIDAGFIPNLQPPNEFQVGLNSLTKILTH
jgi:ATP-dependent RNA helicase DHX37/DHR1